MAKVFDRLGITAEVETKAKYGAGGAKGLAALAVARGEAEIGIQQMAELLAVPEVDLVGPLPAALQAVTQFTAAVPSGAAHAAGARALIDFLGSPTAKSVIKAKGLEPN
jgi:molybdate transport system substrate-binding protein